MLDKIDKQVFLAEAANAKRVAMYQEILGDRITPVGVMLALGERAREATLLESSINEKHAGRHSFIGFDVLAEFRAKGDTCSVFGVSEKTERADPFVGLEQFRQRHAYPVVHPLRGFLGGLAGFVAYDAVRLVEALPDHHVDQDQLPDLQFRAYRHHVNFDHKTGVVLLGAVIDLTDDLDADYERGVQALYDLKTLIFSAAPAPQQLHETSVDFEADVDDADFCDVVKKVKQAIHAGDVFQVVPSREFSRATQVDPFSIYRALCVCSPSPYMFYIDSPNFHIAGASPERFVSVQGRHVQSSPLAGTRPRSETEFDDERIADELLADEKEVAEHTMLVDLARNDLGRIADVGSVKVSSFKNVYRYSHVMHISSTVEAQLRVDKTPIDVIKTSLIAGTLSGAPKIRAMSLIDELEGSRRGIYGGMVGFFDCDNNLESCIAIRMALIKDGRVRVRAGAGVVFDSDPQCEANETRAKATSVLDAITVAERGL